MKSFLKNIKAILTDSRKVSLTVWALERERGELLQVAVVGHNLFT